MVLKTEIALTENRADFRSRLKTRYRDIATAGVQSANLLGVASAEGIW
jgi:hypothetical protein